jgi:hypothetical protein
MRHLSVTGNPSKSDIWVVLLHPGVDRLTSLSSIHLAALKGVAVHTWSLQSQVVHRNTIPYVTTLPLVPGILCGLNDT